MPEPMNIHEEIGRRVDALILSSGVPAYVVALALGISKSTMSRKLRGLTVWTVDDLFSITEIFKCSFEELLPSQRPTHQRRRLSPDQWRQGRRRMTQRPHLYDAK